MKIKRYTNNSVLMFNFWNFLKSKEFLLSLIVSILMTPSFLIIHYSLSSSILIFFILYSLFVLLFLKSNSVYKYIFIDSNKTFKYSNSKLKDIFNSPINKMENMIYRIYRKFDLSNKFLFSLILFSIIGIFISNSIYVLTPFYFVYIFSMLYSYFVDTKYKLIFEIHYENMFE